MEVMHEIADQVGFLGESGVGGIIFMLLVWPRKPMQILYFMRVMQHPLA